MENRVLSAVKTIRRKKKLGAYPSISVVLSITLAVLVIGVFGIVLIFYQSQSDIIKNHITVQVYLEKELSQTKVDSLKQVISTQQYVLVQNNTPAVKYITKEEAAKRFIEETGEDFIKLLGENPLPDAFLININPTYANPESLKKIKQKLDNIDEIHEVVYFSDLVENINNIIPKIGLALLIIASILTLISIFLIHNSIKLALFSQRFLIRSMQLMGAKSSFIRWPFLSRAIFLGLLSGVLAVAILFVIVNGLDQFLDEFDVHLHIYNTPEVILGLVAGMVLTGCVIGFISTYWAVSKYLKMRLEELY